MGTFRSASVTPIVNPISAPKIIVTIQPLIVSFMDISLRPIGWKALVKTAEMSRAGKIWKLCANHTVIFNIGNSGKIVNHWGGTISNRYRYNLRTRIFMITIRYTDLNLVVGFDWIFQSIIEIYVIMNQAFSTFETDIETTKINRQVNTIPPLWKCSILRGREKQLIAGPVSTPAIKRAQFVVWSYASATPWACPPTSASAGTWPRPYAPATRSHALRSGSEKSGPLGCWGLVRPPSTGPQSSPLG